MSFRKQERKKGIHKIMNPFFDYLIKKTVNEISGHGCEESVYFCL